MRTNRTNNFKNKTHFIKTLQIFSSKHYISLHFKKHEISTQNITTNFIKNITIYFTKILWLNSSKHYNSLHSNILTHLIKKHTTHFIKTLPLTYQNITTHFIKTYCFISSKYYDSFHQEKICIPRTSSKVTNE